MASNIITKADITKTRIVRALMCATGFHEPYETINNWNGRCDKVYVFIPSLMHGEVNCAVCKHCRTVYIRRRIE